MGRFFFRRKVAALRAAVCGNDTPAALALMACPGLARAASGGEECILRLALRQENPELVGHLLRAGARPSPPTATQMALWVERVERRRRQGQAVEKARQAALEALVLLDRAGLSWEATSASLGSGDSARFVIEHAWPGILPAPGV